MPSLKRVPVPVILMLAFAAAVLASALSQRGIPFRGRASATGPRPEDVILAAFDAAKRGDTRAYESCFTGKLLADLQRSRKEMGEQRFRDYLREGAASVKGIALSDRLDTEDGMVRLRVEMIYAEKNDVQTYTLCTDGPLRRAWKVYAVTDARRVRTVVPYGANAIPLGR